MPFNSLPFLFLYLPIVVGIYWGLLKVSRDYGHHWLILASLGYVASWKFSFVWVLIASVLINYWIAEHVGPLPKRTESSRTRWMVLGLALNILSLVWFKYAGVLTGSSILLPIGISFYTFVQIQYLMDIYQETASLCTLRDYFVAVSFFPSVTAGPITNPNHIVPQLSGPGGAALSVKGMTAGTVLFSIGLFKKVLLADTLGHFVDPIFAKTAGGLSISFLEAWVGALGFTFQLYFDFSGYSDMAIGAARLFGIALPLNFNSPYRAGTIIDFWKRWHMTLTHFLTSYIYNPMVLAISRYRVNSRSTVSVATILLPTLLTMLIAGIWHGTGWTFVIFGLLHGLYLCVCHLWRLLKTPLGTFVGGSITFLGVVVSFVFFRAGSIPAAEQMLRAMTSPQFPSHEWRAEHFLQGLGLLLLSSCIVWFFPNSQTLAFGEEAKKAWIRWNPNFASAAVHGCLLAASLWMIYAMAQPSEFIYFKF